jgi:hypothetical protein
MSTFQQLSILPEIHLNTISLADSQQQFMENATTILVKSNIVVSVGNVFP